MIGHACCHHMAGFVRRCAQEPEVRVKVGALRPADRGAVFDDAGGKAEAVQGVGAGKSGGAGTEDHGVHGRRQGIIRAESYRTVDLIVTLPTPSADALAHSEQVRAHIISAIVAAGGWVSFARYMDLALYAPGLGYYAAGATKFGVAGDFVTAPGLTALFGQTVANTVAAVLAELADTGGGAVLELGAGEGHLAADLLNGLARLACVPTHYFILEVSADLRERQRARLAAAAPQGLERVVWLDALPTQFSGVIVANEVLDAVPVECVRWHAGAVYERGVSVSEPGAFAWTDRPLLAGALHERVSALPAPKGDYVSEISLAVPALVASLAACLTRGALLFFDYGFPQAEFYHPQRTDGTLMCHYRHHAHADPFWLPGLNDMTAHVDFSAVATAGVAEGLSLLGYTSQGNYLLQAGLLDRLAALEVGSNAYLRATAAVQTLLQPHEMGELFKVVALGRGIERPVLGFERGDRRHAL
jgi:SAM-dependent MidA family methyltransferase